MPRKFTANVTAASVAALLLAAGCNIHAPDRFTFTAPEIRVGADRTAAGEEIPPTRTHDEARAELRKAYDRIAALEKDKQLLRDENSRLRSENQRLSHAGRPAEPQRTAARDR